MNGAIGPILRQWRKLRRYSQLQLAVELGISSKHISFMETGRSAPSRDMILRVGEFLFLPKREINRGLYSAGFAPVYADLPVDHVDLKPVFSAIDQLIVNHMPYPAIVLNQYWDVVKANASAITLLSELGYAGQNNLIEALILDDPETSKIVNWHESVLLVLVRLRHEISILGGSDRLEALAKKLAACVNSDEDLINIGENKAILSTKFNVADRVLSFFSIISQFSTIQDVTVSEFKVELMFPSDECTTEYYARGNVS